MIDFSYLSDFQLVNENLYSNWLLKIAESEGKILGDLNYIFCDDAYLLEINQKYLKHDTYTDIISFDYSKGNTIGGDVFISIERVRENSTKFEVSIDNELLRVMSHGVLHLIGYGDKEEEEVKVMRAKEEEKIKLFHVEQTR